MDLNNNILTNLQCPGCKEYLVRPVFLCSLGHSICNDCCRKVSKCPVCVRPLLDGIRNYTLEGVIDLLLYPCPHAEHGCETKSKLDELNWHGEICEYRTYPCHVTDVTGKCSWYGKSSNLGEHIIADHPRDGWLQNGEAIMWLSDKYCSVVDSKIIFFRKDDFWLHRYQQDGVMCWAVQFLGDQDKSADFKFNLVICQKTTENDADTSFDRALPLSCVTKRISLEGGVQPDALAPQELFKNPLRYVSLSVQVFLTFKDEKGAVWYEVQIENQNHNCQNTQRLDETIPNNERPRPHIHVDSPIIY